MYATLQPLSHRWPLVCIVCFAMILTASGCGKPFDYANSTVCGLVTIDGQPVVKGDITFTPTKPGQGPSVGGKIVDGKYQCEHVPVGKLRVTFHAQSGKPKMITDVATGQKHEVPQSILPSQYAPGIETDVQAGRITLDFPLVSKSQTAANPSR